MLMKAFVREQGPIIAGMTVVTLGITALAGGSMAVFYLVSFACLAAVIWWEARKGRFD
jgi:hypothetical protein